MPTVALAYAERHPHRVTEIVLASGATTMAWEIEWITRGVGVFFPEPWARFRDGFPEAELTGSLVEAYHRPRTLQTPATARYGGAAAAVRYLRGDGLKET